MQVCTEHIMMLVEDQINRQNLNNLMQEKMIIAVYKTDICDQIITSRAEL